MNQHETVTIFLQTYTELYDFKTTIQQEGLVVENCHQTMYYSGSYAHDRLIDDIRDYESRIQILESELANLKNKKRSWCARIKYTL